MLYDRLIRLHRIENFEINRKAVWGLLGYRFKKTVISPRVKSLVEECFREAENLIKPAGTYIIRRIKEKNDSISFYNTKITLRGESMKKLLKDSYSVIFMAVTIGPGIDEKIKEETESGRMERAIIFDVIGSEAVEAVANSLNSLFDTQARHARSFLTMRFSPGYGDLGLEFQREIYEELKLDEMGIKINEKNLLYPQKTITAVIGVER